MYVLSKCSLYSALICSGCRHNTTGWAAYNRNWSAHSLEAKSKTETPTASVPGDGPPPALQTAAFSRPGGGGPACWGLQALTGLLTRAPPPTASSKPNHPPALLPNTVTLRAGPQRMGGGRNSIPHIVSLEPATSPDSPISSDSSFG